MRKMNKKQVVILVLYSIVLLLGHNFYSYAYNHPAEVLFLSELCFLYPISQTFHLYIICISFVFYLYFICVSQTKYNITSIKIKIN